ncbi:MAG: segregation/condensation protein A [bacterium]
MIELSYNIKLDIFEGPLDLLLHLIKKNELDVYDIPIVVITEQYLSCIEFMKTLNLDIAGEFLVMAASLMYIKSKTMLPVQESEDLVLEEDPRIELRNQLLEYQKYKEIALTLENFAFTHHQLFTRQEKIDNNFSLQDVDLTSLELTLFDLLSAFKNLFDKAKEEKFHEIDREEVSIQDKISIIIDRLQQQNGLLFKNLFDSYHKLELIITFLALLELIKLKRVRAIQRDIFSDLRIYLNDVSKSP